MNHVFNVEIAKEYGMLEAVIFANIEFWVKKNEANDKNFFDGEYWTYNSLSAFEELFPYATKNQIRRALDHLRNEKLIEVGHYGEKLDRSLWYTIKITTAQFCQMHLAQNANGFGTERKCICEETQMDLAQETNDIYINNNINISNTDINTDINSIYKRRYKTGDTALEEEFNVLWERYPNKKGRKDALRHYISARKNGVLYETISEGLNNYLEFIRTTEAEERFIKHGSTWFCQQSWDDVYEVPKKARSVLEEIMNA